jgi:probable HAF family extracellular repeat protein
MLSKRKTRWNVVIVLTCLMLIGFVSTGRAKGKPVEARYEVVDLGSLGGGSCYAGDIIDSGQVVGLSKTTSGESLAFLLTPEDVDGDGTPDLWNRDDNGDGANDLMVPLGTLGGSSSEACSVNNLGQVVGDSTTDDEPAKYHAFLWPDELGEMIDLGTLGGDLSQACSVNNLGLVVGVAQTADDPVEAHAFLWSEDLGEMIDLGTMGGVYSVASFIHDSGQVVGRSQILGWSNNTVTGNRAFLITPQDVDGDGNLDWFADQDYDGANDLMVDLGTLGGFESQAVAMNDYGQIAGWAHMGDGKKHAFLITPEDTDADGVPDLWNRDDNDDGANDLMTDLGTFESLLESSATDLNNAVQVIGRSYTTSVKSWVGGPYGQGEGEPDDFRTTFLWEDGQMEDLNTLTNSGIEIRTASAINNAGQIVGRIYENISHAYIAVPIPESSKP